MLFHLKSTRRQCFVKFSYCFLGYVQGMSDLLSPLLFVTQNEVESFWCLTGFMDLLVSKHSCLLTVYCLVNAGVLNLLTPGPPTVFNTIPLHISTQ